MPRPFRTKTELKAIRFVNKTNEVLSVKHIQSKQTLSKGYVPKFRVATKGPSGAGRLRQHKH